MTDTCLVASLPKDHRHFVNDHCPAPELGLDVVEGREIMSNLGMKSEAASNEQAHEAILGHVASGTDSNLRNFLDPIRSIEQTNISGVNISSVKL